MTAAILISFSVACKHLGLDPFAWLSDIFTCIAGTCDQGPMFGIAHYYTQNGDMV